MIKVKNKDEVVTEMHAAYSKYTKRLVAVNAGTWEKTLDQFETDPQTMNPTTINKIADHFGYDVELRFIKRENANADEAKAN